MTPTGVKVSEVLDAARRGRALLAPEIAGYLVLAAADQLSKAPVVLDEHTCGLLLDGGRVIVAPSNPSTGPESERALRGLLRRLLDAANGRAPALSAVANGSAKGDVATLVAELESALIPVNRSAAGRALSRLARDAVRARTEGVDLKSPANAAPAVPLASPLPIELPLEPPGEDTEPIPNEERLSNTDVATVEVGELVDDPVVRPSAAASPDRPAPSTSDVDDLLAARLSSVPPEPAPIASAPPAPQPPSLALSPSPPEAAPLAPSPTSQAAPPVDERSSEAPARPSHPSSRGVDELILGFMATTSRKEERVAQDLRKMTGVEDPPLPQGVSSMPPAVGGYESPFHNAAGAADFYTATPPPRRGQTETTSAPRAMAAQSVAPGLDEDLLGKPSTSRMAYLLFAILAVLTLGTVTLLRLEPGFLSGRTAEVVEAEKHAAAIAAASAAARNAAGSCRATLIVADVPQGSEVLLRSGVAPVDVERVPSGARLEFVALVDGYAPRRGVVPKGAEWDLASNRPRFELPIQLEKSRAKGAALDAWPSTEPGSVVGGQGPPGIVHVVTSPRGAEVWMVAGSAPQAKLEALPCGVGLELLIAGVAEGQPFRRRLRVDSSQLTPEPQANTVTGRVSAK